MVISIPTKAAQTDAAVAEVTHGTQALTPIAGSAARQARELSGGFAGEFKRIVGLAVDAHRQASHYLGDPTAWV